MAVVIYCTVYHPHPHCHFHHHYHHHHHHHHRYYALFNVQPVWIMIETDTIKSFARVKSRMNSQMSNSFGLSWGLTIIWSFCPCIPNCKALRRAVEQQQPPALREALAEALSGKFPWHFGTFRIVSPSMWLVASCGSRCHAYAYRKGRGQTLLGPNDQPQHLSFAGGCCWKRLGTHRAGAWAPFHKEPWRGIVQESDERFSDESFQLSAIYIMFDPVCNHDPFGWSWGLRWAHDKCRELEHEVWPTRNL